MLSFNDKTQMITILGETQSLAYFQAITAPMLINHLGWSVSMLVTQMNNQNAPLGQLARLPKVQNHLIELDEAREAAEKARREREYQEWYNSPEQVKQREEDAQALHQARLKQSMEIRGARAIGARGNDVNYAKSIMFEAWES